MLKGSGVELVEMEKEKPIERNMTTELVVICTLALEALPIKLKKSV